MRLCLIPDPAPPYDDESGEATDTATPGTRGFPGTPGIPTAAQAVARRQDPAPPSQPLQLPSRPAGLGTARPAGSRGEGPLGQREPSQQQASERAPAARETGRSGRPAAAGAKPALSPAWPSRFAQVLAETLAGSRPPRQMVPWTTEHARMSIERIGPSLAAGARPRVRRVLTSQPAQDVLEMTVVVGFGPRVRALAVRLERASPAPASPGRPAQPARWMCTAVEAA